VFLELDYVALPSRNLYYETLNSVYFSESGNNLCVSVSEYIVSERSETKLLRKSFLVISQLDAQILFNVFIYL